MPIIKNGFENFLHAIETNADYQKYSEMRDFIDSHEHDKEFFELCQTFINISLNAPKYSNKDTLEIQGCFLFSDTELAKNATLNFVNKFKIKNVKELLDVIKIFYPHASNFDDKRQKAASIFKNLPHRTPAYGMYFDFTRIPDNVWSDIEKEILEAIE